MIKSFAFSNFINSKNYKNIKITIMTQKEKFMLLKQIIKERAELQRVLKANRKTVNFKGERTKITFDMCTREYKTGKLLNKKVELDSAYAAKYVCPWNLYINYEIIDGQRWCLCETRIPGFANKGFDSTTDIIADLNYLYRILRNERKTVKKSEELINGWNIRVKNGTYLKKAYDWFKNEEA